MARLFNLHHYKDLTGTVFHRTGVVPVYYDDKDVLCGEKIA